VLSAKSVSSFKNLLQQTDGQKTNPVYLVMKKLSIPDFDLD